MTVGLRIYHPEKGVVLDITDSLTRILGSFIADTPTGGRTVYIENNDNLFVFFVPEGEKATPLTLEIKGNQISWTYRMDFDKSKVQRVYYGTY